MSAAIYQRARPVQWDEVVGQEHVKDVLRPAVERGRIGHAYLFSGPRGVGKTTTARLIAMAVNCEAPEGAVRPCGQCASCQMVIAGRHPDVLEIDAASNNSVDDVRDLREKVNLTPMRGRRKVYVLDEAHMMSKSAFNALLKTLEEPPEHVVFVLATTEPERLPPTILSRCQHYRFRRLSADEIAGKLARLAGEEGVSVEPAALKLMARASDGAMRDGESLLERLFAGGEKNVTVGLVEGALGLPPQDRIAALALSLVDGDSVGVLGELGRLYGDGFAPRTVTDRAKVALRDLLHARLGLNGEAAPEGVEPGLLLRLIRALDEQDERFVRSSDLIALEMAFTRALLARDEAPGASTGDSVGLEGRLARLESAIASGSVSPAPSERLVRPSLPDFDPTSRAPRQRPAEERPAPVASEEPPAAEVRRPERPTAAPATAARANPAPANGSWADVVAKANARLKAFLKEANGELQGGVLVITYGAKHKWHAEQVANRLDEVRQLVRDVLGDAYALELRSPDGTKKALGVAPEGNTRRGPTSAPTPASRAAAAPLTVEEPPAKLEPRLAPLAPSDLDFDDLGGPVSSAPELEEAQALFDIPAAPPEQAASIEPAPVEEDFEVASLEALGEEPPLEAFDDEQTLPPAAVAATAAELRGHPSYGLVDRLFPHRVREAGRVDDAPAPEATPHLEEVDAN